MMRYALALGLLASLIVSLPQPSHATEIAVAENLRLDINLSQGWTLHLTAPEELVKEAARHVAHESAAANATPEQVESVARKRMAANEAFLYHAASGAHLDIDFSPLEPGTLVPSAQTLRSSAEYAARSLDGEDDVTGLVWDVDPVKIGGVDDVYLLTASYLQHDHPMVFRGYVGYVEKYWFFLYFTAPGEEVEALQEMQVMLDHASIRITGG